MRQKPKPRYGARLLQDVAEELQIGLPTLRSWAKKLHLTNERHAGFIIIHPAGFNRLVEYKKLREEGRKSYGWWDTKQLTSYSEATTSKLKKEIHNLNPDRYWSKSVFCEEEIALIIAYRERLRQLTSQTSNKYWGFKRQKNRGEITEEERKRRVEELTLQKKEKSANLIREIYEKEFLPLSLTERKKFINNKIRPLQEANRRKQEEFKRRYLYSSEEYETPEHQIP